MGGERRLVVGRGEQKGMVGSGGKCGLACK